MDRDQSSGLDEMAFDLGHLSSGVGHHVINAFSAIVSNAEVYRLLANTPSALDPIAVSDLIIKTAVDASGVARLLIDYTRAATAVGSGRVQLDRLVSMVAESGRAESRPEVEWTTRIDPVPTVAGNEFQLFAMFRHLLDNALEALPAVGGTIGLSASLDGRGWVVLEVRDTGQGMSSSVLERAVEPFFSTKPDHRGVGLSIANGIWRRHRGTLALLSSPGEGTTVRLCVDPSNVAVPPRTARA